MTTTQAPTPVDTDKLMEFVFRAVDEVGATLNAALVVMGDKLGYYRDLAAHGPSTPARSPSAPAPSEPYAREWLNAQAAGGYVTYDPATGTLHAAARAGGRAHRRGQPGVPARLLPDRRSARSTTPSHDPRGGHAAAPASAGTSTTPTCTSAASGSSGPATTRTWSPSGCRPSTASSTS